MLSCSFCFYDSGIRGLDRFRPFHTTVQTKVSENSFGFYTTTLLRRPRESIADRIKFQTPTILTRCSFIREYRRIEFYRVRCPDNLTDLSMLTSRLDIVSSARFLRKHADFLFGQLVIIKAGIKLPIYTVSATPNVRRRVSCQSFDCSNDHKEKLQHVSKHSIVTVPREDMVDETRSAFAEEQPGRPICTVKNRKRIRYQTYARGRLPVDDLVAIAN